MRHSDDELRAYLADEESSINLSRHFDSVTGDWADISEEGLRILSLNGEEIAVDDPAGEVIASVAARSAQAAFDAVAAALGVNAMFLAEAVEQWYERDSAVPAPIGPVALMRRVAEYQEASERFHARMRDLDKGS